MSFFLAKRFSLFSPSSFHHQQLSLLLPPLLRLSFSTQPSEQADIPFLAKYLISSLGFSPDKALKCSTDSAFTTVKSSDQPESVVRFLKETGLSDDQIKNVVSFYPRLLASNVETILKPKVRELMDGGFSGELLVQLIRSNPKALVSKHTLSRLLFWRDFVGKGDQALLKILLRNGWLIQYDLDKYVAPRINLFKEYGLSNPNIVRVLEHGHTMSRSLDSLKETLMFIEELGIPRESGKFFSTFNALCRYSKEKLKRKAEFIKTTCGWSQEELCSALTRAPSVLASSENKIKSTMDFLIQQAKLEPGSIASQPLLLTYSLEKRLVPRHHVLGILVAKGLEKSCNLSTVCILTEKTFLEKYIEPYKKEAPELVEAYSAALSQNISV
ncbi:transcription termination factor MTERF8, chloroplastic-like [Carex rostrata]